MATLVLSSISSLDLFKADLPLIRRLAPAHLKASIAGLLAAGVLAQPCLSEDLPSLPSIALPADSERMRTFQEASTDVAMAAYPLVQSLQAKNVAPLASKTVALAATGDPKDIIKTIDAGLDAFLSVPPDRFFDTARTLKAAASTASSADRCNLVCMPPKEQVEAVVTKASDALTVTNPDKLKTFIFQGAMSLASGERQQYAGVLAEALKFSLSLDKGDLSRLKEGGTALVLAIDNAQAAAPPAKLPTVKAFPKNRAIEDKALELADGLYPLVQSLQAKTVAPLASKTVALAATGDPKEIIRTIDAGLDAFLSVPADRFFAAATALKSATAEAVTVDSCNLVCVPRIATVEAVAGKMANALSVTDPSKLKAFVYQAIRSLQSGDKGQLAATMAEGRKFEALLDQAEVRKVADATVGLLDAAGVPLSESETAWLEGFAGLR